MDQSNLSHIMHWTNTNSTCSTSAVPTLSTPDHTSLDLDEDEAEVGEREEMKEHDSVDWNTNASSIAVDVAETAARLHPVTTTGEGSGNGAFQCSGTSTGLPPNSGGSGGPSSSGGFGSGGGSGGYGRQMSGGSGGAGGWGQGRNTQQPPIPPPMMPNQSLQVRFLFFLAAIYLQLTIKL